MEEILREWDQPRARWRWVVVVGTVEGERGMKGGWVSFEGSGKGEKRRVHGEEERGREVGSGWTDARAEVDAERERAERARRRKEVGNIG